MPGDGSMNGLCWYDATPTEAKDGKLSIGMDGGRKKKVVTRNYKEVISFVVLKQPIKVFFLNSTLLHLDLAAPPTDGTVFHHSLRVNRMGDSSEKNDR